MKIHLFCTVLLAVSLLSQCSAQIAAPIPGWHKLNTVPYRGKQDDIFFVTPKLGWYVNGGGKIYKTVDGGDNWKEQYSHPGTYFRCVGFVNEQHGFAGNIGTDYFPGVTDTTPLYETKDGGETWKPVTNIVGATPKGLCAIEIVRRPFINAGKLDYKTTIYAGGRVGTPAFLMVSDDDGATWKSQDMGKVCAMILDIKFTNPKIGFICAGTWGEVDKSHALILRTTDGGKKWKKVFESARPYELTWKGHFPTKEVGYVTIQNYNPDKTITGHTVAKTEDGGKTWHEIPLTDNKAAQEFGVAFLDANTGWIGTTASGFLTENGGKSWTPVEMGQAVNKIRLIKDEQGEITGYAIGVSVYKWTKK